MSSWSRYDVRSRARARRTALAGVAIAAVTLVAACGGDGKPTDSLGNGVAAEAAGQTISNNSLRESVDRGLKAPGAKVKADELTRTTLERRIRLALLKREAERMGVTVPAAETAKTRVELEKQTEQGGGLVKAAAEAGIVESELGGLVDLFTYQRLLSEKLTKDAPVTDDELRAFFEAPENKARLEVAEVSHILVKDKALADKLLKRLEGGADFGTLAYQNSTDKGSAPNGGFLGRSPRGKYVPAFEKVAWSADVGKVSAPVKTEFGYHLIKVTDRPSFDKIKETIRGQATGQVGRDRLLAALRKAGGVTVNPRYGRWDDKSFQIAPADGGADDPSSPNPGGTAPGTPEPGTAEPSAVPSQ